MNYSAVTQKRVPMDEELKYKRYRENITTLVFSDATSAFRSNLSTDGGASDITKVIPAKKLY